MSEIDDLREKRKTAWGVLKSSHTLLKRAKELHEALEKRYARDKEAYEVCDHRLALIDGRAQRFAAAMSGKHKVKERPISDFTEEEIVELARKLGVTLIDVEPSDEEREDEYGKEETPNA